MDFKKKIASKEDKTVKYIFSYEGQDVEFSYIDNGTDKDIICVPCQTMCNQSCSFCYLTKHVGKIKANHIDSASIKKAIMYIVTDLSLNPNRELLISFMGAGEPLDRWKTMSELIHDMTREQNNIRFAFSTMLPKNRIDDFVAFARRVKEHKLNVKMHLSLHWTDDMIRSKEMPNATPIKDAMFWLAFWNKFTGNDIEVHYVLMQDELSSNCMPQNLIELEKLFKAVDIQNDATLKFMMYSDDKGNSKRVDKHFAEALVSTALEHTKLKKVEYYEPPGNDIGSSCGQFLTQE